MDVTERLWVCDPDDVSRHPFAVRVDWMAGMVLTDARSLLT